MIVLKYDVHKCKELTCCGIYFRALQNFLLNLQKKVTGRSKLFDSTFILKYSINKNYYIITVYNA